MPFILLSGTSLNFKYLHIFLLSLGGSHTLNWCTYIWLRSLLIFSKTFKFSFSIVIVIISSLAVLEGVAIGIKPDYKVLGSTYPWIARKVLTDPSPQLKSSLQALLYEVYIIYICRKYICIYIHVNHLKLFHLHLHSC